MILPATRPRCRGSAATRAGNGYILFPNKQSYERCPYLDHPASARADGRLGTKRTAAKGAQTRRDSPCGSPGASRAYSRKIWEGAAPTADTCYSTTMIKPLEDALAKVLRLPEDKQAVAAELLEQLAANEVEPYRLSEEERDVVRKALARAQRGEFASDESVQDALRQPWG